MTTHVMFLQGAGSGAYEEDKRLVERLQRTLGPDYAIRYPEIPDDGEASFAQWRELIDRELAEVSGPVIMVGHSVGASVLMTWLGERADERKIAGVFLIAAPFWGGDGWRYDGYEELELPSGIGSELPGELPIFFYHCRDDDVAPFEHLALYAAAIPQATVRGFDAGGHQFGDDLSAVARDIASLSRAA